LIPASISSSPPYLFFPLILYNLFESNPLTFKTTYGLLDSVLVETYVAQATLDLLDYAISGEDNEPR
jgi:hypothetical protein